jgi:hypothetical protein
LDVVVYAVELGEGCIGVLATLEHDLTTAGLPGWVRSSVLRVGT